MTKELICLEPVVSESTHWRATSDDVRHLLNPTLWQTHLRRLAARSPARGFTAGRLVNATHCRAQRSSRIGVCPDVHRL